MNKLKQEFRIFNYEVYFISCLSRFSVIEMLSIIINLFPGPDKGICP